MSISEFAQTLNAWSACSTPFLFIVDFELRKPLVFRLSELDPSVIRYSVNGFSNFAAKRNGSATVNLQKSPESFDTYLNRFEKVIRHLEYGDTFLTNLTICTPVSLDCTLDKVYEASQAKYKVWVRDQFLVFSPETFVKIMDRKVFSYPMKGTIDAGIPDAEQIILKDKKEEAEHVTIVDLIRNDLSQVATNVRVNRFRYIDTIHTNTKQLLQVSSEVVGDLAPDYKSRLGDIIVNLLPAGSVSGAPKQKTLEVIREAEEEERGYFTGVFGCFDGEKLDSGVMIRYIGQSGEQYHYRSGGGITTQSNAAQEYQEAIDKIYVPLD